MCTAEQAPSLFSYLDSDMLQAARIDSPDASPVGACTRVQNVAVNDAAHIQVVSCRSVHIWHSRQWQVTAYGHVLYHSQQAQPGAPKATYALQRSHARGMSMPSWPQKCPHGVLLVKWRALCHCNIRNLTYRALGCLQCMLPDVVCASLS